MLTGIRVASIQTIWVHAFTFVGLRLKTVPVQSIEHCWILNQIIQMWLKTFSFDSKGLTKVLHQQFRIYRLFKQSHFQRLNTSWSVRELHGQAKLLYSKWSQVLDFNWVAKKRGYKWRELLEKNHVRQTGSSLDHVTYSFKQKRMLWPAQQYQKTAEDNLSRSFQPFHNI